MAHLVMGVSLKRIGAASALILLAACTVPPESQLTSSLPPLSTLEPAQAVSAEPVAKVIVPGQPSRLTLLARRLLEKFWRSPEPVESEPSSDNVANVDEKYQLTGKAALELERGHASWYGGRFHGRPTASGETYDKYALTAAHKTLPFGTIVRVRSLALGREINVRINDRGPFTPGRVIDLSHAAAKALGLTKSGVGGVSLNVSKPSADFANLASADDVELMIPKARLNLAASELESKPTVRASTRRSKYQKSVSKAKTAASKAVHKKAGKSKRK